MLFFRERAPGCKARKGKKPFPTPEYAGEPISDDDMKSCRLLPLKSIKGRNMRQSKVVPRISASPLHGAELLF